MATSEFSLSQTIKEPKHILSNSDSYTDLIFTSQINLVMQCILAFIRDSTGIVNIKLSSQNSTYSLSCNVQAVSLALSTSKY